MVSAPKVFISATTRDLASARQAVSQALVTLGCLPVVQEHFPPDARTVRDMLREKIQESHAVVHLVGFQFGGEPANRPENHPRRSYTQMEYDMAVQLKKPVYIYLFEKDYPFDPPEDVPPEDEEAQGLQEAHRSALRRREEIHTRISTEDQLREKIRELQVQVEELKRETTAHRRAVERFRRVLAAGLVGLIFVLTAMGIQLWRLESRYDQQRLWTEEVVGKMRTQNPVDARLTPRERYEEALDAVAFHHHLVPEELRKAIDGWVSHVLSDPNAKSYDKALAAFQQHDFKAAAQEAGRAAAEAQDRAYDALILAGNAEIELGRYVVAQKHFEKALALTDREDNPERWVDVRIKLADALANAGHILRAEPLLREAIAAAEQHHGSNHPQTALALQSLGVILQAAGRHGDTEALFHRAVGINESAFPGGHRQLAASLRGLGLALTFIGKPDEAKPLLLRALTMDESRTGPSRCRDMADDLVALASLFQRQNDLKTAMAHALRALRMCEEELGAEHPYVGYCLIFLGAFHHLEGNIREAESEYRRALALGEKALGDQHPAIGLVKLTLGSLLFQKRRHSEAESLLRAALANFIAGYGVDNPNVAFCQRALADILSAEKRYLEAASLYQSALEIQLDLPGTADEQVIILNNLARMLEEGGKPLEAEARYREALEILIKSGNERNLNGAVLMGNLADLLRSSGRPAEAERFYRDALKTETMISGAGYRGEGIRKNNLALVVEALGRNEEAEELFWQAVGQNEKEFGAEHQEVNTSLANLFRVLGKTGRSALGKQWLQRSLEEQSLSSGNDRPPLLLFRRCYMAGWLAGAGRLADAIVEIDKTIQLVEKGEGTKAKNLPALLRLKSDWEMALGRLAEAEDSFRRGVEIMKSQDGAGHLEPSALLVSLAAWLESAQTMPADLSGVNRTARPFLEANEHASLKTPDEWGVLGVYLLKTGRFEEAVPWLRKVLAAKESEDGTLDLGGSCVAAHNLSKALRLSKTAPAECCFLLAQRALTFQARALNTQDMAHPALARVIDNFQECLRMCGVPSGEFQARVREAMEASLPTGRISPEIDIVLDSRRAEIIMQK